jgi:23S rRNA (cytosine1962-C5)-methyltransferase
MSDPSGHELLDLGDGRQLDRFGPCVLDRPSPGAAWHTPRDPAAWATADGRYDREAGGRGGWTTTAGTIAPWQVDIGGIAFELRLSDSGQVGVFPEQAPTWRWLRDRTAALTAGRPDQTPEVLNLFGYTGGCSIVAAAAGAVVVHVDAAKPSVAWARRNAALNGLAEAPVRWIVDDAAEFVRRERRRERRYDGIVLDPPTYGHGTGGRAWRLEADLAGLLEDCAALIASTSAYLVLSAHTPGFGADRLADELHRALGPDAGGSIEADDLAVHAVDGRRLLLGAVARWSR